MQKTIVIDGRPVAFRATAAIPRLYRIKFGRDILRDMVEVQKAAEKAQAGETSIPPQLLEVFENMAFLMARHAQPNMKAQTADEWLDGFQTFSIYQILPELLDLWNLNNQTMETSKKNAGDGEGDDHRALPPAGGAVRDPHSGLGPAHHRHGDGYVYRGRKRRL